MDIVPSYHNREMMADEIATSKQILIFLFISHLGSARHQKMCCSIKKYLAIYAKSGTFEYCYSVTSSQI